MTALPTRNRSPNWTRLQNAGERERNLWDLIKARGVDWVCATVMCSRSELEAWAANATVPGDRERSVIEAMRSHVAGECARGRGKIDVERAWAMRAAGAKLLEIAVTFGCNEGSVSKALQRRTRKRSQELPPRRVEGVELVAEPGDEVREKDAA